MDLTEHREGFLRAVLSLNRAEADRAIEVALATGIDPTQVLIEIINGAMDVVGQKQANRELVLSRIYLISKIVDAAINRVLSVLPKAPRTVGTVVIGTPQGDHHGLGRKIVGSFLRAAGIQVIDLGISVPGRDFVSTAIGMQAEVIAMSALLLHTIEEVTRVREILDQRGLQRRIKLVVGGAPFTFDAELYRQVGADATGKNATDAVRVIRQMIAEVHHA